MGSSWSSEAWEETRTEVWLIGTTAKRPGGWGRQRQGTSNSGEGEKEAGPDHIGIESRIWILTQEQKETT